MSTTARAGESDNMMPTLPSGLPEPVDDGACNHLTGLTLPRIRLPSTNSSAVQVDLSALDGLTIVFCYPRSAAAGESVPPDWDAIPGARGCTPQACSFRDNAGALYASGVKFLFGLSTQGSETQREFHDRTHLSYDLLSDEKLQFAEALKLPLFEWKGQPLIKRLTLAISKGKIIKFWYPVFPPDQNVFAVLEWLKGEVEK